MTRDLIEPRLPAFGTRTAGSAIRNPAPPFRRWVALRTRPPESLNFTPSGAHPDGEWFTSAGCRSSEARGPSCFCMAGSPPLPPTTRFRPARISVHSGRDLLSARIVARPSDCYAPAALNVEHPTEADMLRCLEWPLALLSLVLSSSTVLAHSWYPTSCCSDRDCRALVEEIGETVTEFADGWKLWDGRTIARGIVRLSPDRQFHLCETRSHRILCFFAPPGAS